MSPTGVGTVSRSVTDNHSTTELGIDLASFMNGTITRSTMNGNQQVGLVAGELSRSALRGLGIQLPVWIDVQKDVLKQMGVPSSAIAESSVELGTTRQEAAYIGQEARRGGMSRVIVVTWPYHTRRLVGS